MTIFTPPINPSLGGVSLVTTPRVLSAPFGDGYRQDAGDGLNTLPRTLDLTWDVLTLDQYDEIESFFSSMGGYRAFLWTIPGLSVSRQWKCTTWTSGVPNLDMPSMNAHFEQVFDI